MLGPWSPLLYCRNCYRIRRRPKIFPMRRGGCWNRYLERGFTLSHTGFNARSLNFGIWDPIDQEWLETGLICYFKKLKDMPFLFSQPENRINLYTSIGIGCWILLKSNHSQDDAEYSVIVKANNGNLLWKVEKKAPVLADWSINHSKISSPMFLDL